MTKTVMTETVAFLQPVWQPFCLGQLDDSPRHWHGDVAFGCFKRLAAESVAGADQLAEKHIFVNADLNKSHSGVYWLSFQAHGSMVQTCQRCLEPVDVALQVDMSLALVVDDSHLSALHDDDDFIVLAESELYSLRHPSCNEVGALDLLGLIEDELLLSLPQSPKHDTCQLAAPFGAHEDAEDDDATKANPFAALASLKGKLSD